MQEFKFGRTSTNNELRSGRPLDSLDATTSKMMKKILRLVTDDRKLTMHEIFKMVNISTECVHDILHSHLNMQKPCAQWVPRVLTDQQKLKRAVVS